MKNEQGKAFTLDISPENFTALTRMSPAANVQAPEVLKHIMLYGNSGIKGIGDGSDAYFSMSEFSNLKGTDYKLNADLIRDASDPNKLWFKLYKYEKGSSDPKELRFHGTGPGFNSDGSVAIYINGTYNPYLDYLPMGINSEVIKKIESGND